MEKEKKPRGGVYQIRNKINNKIYIGSSKNVEARLSEHRKALLNMSHHNKHMLNCMKKIKLGMQEDLTCNKIDEIFYFE
jgi:predicted GIY-YIG superfamily endonuclease